MGCSAHIFPSTNISSAKEKERERGEREGEEREREREERLALNPANNIFPFL
jgi:hypothetical protein